MILAFLSSVASFGILLADILLSELLKTKSQTIFKDFQLNFIYPIFQSIFPDLSYLVVVTIFYTVSATFVDTTVYESVDSYLKNYESHPERITYMCFNILGQGLLLSFGYFSLFITLIKLTTLKEFALDDPGFILVISSILAGAIKFPKRENCRWNDYFLNTYAIFLSIKMISMVTRVVLRY